MIVLDWSHRVSELRERRTFTREADENERAAMSDLIGNATCLNLAATYSITRKREQRFEVEGRVTARLEQICGVTLEPIVQEIDEPLEVAFEPEAGRDAELDTGFDPLGEDPPEAIVNNRLDVGRIVAEIVASAADPFPRAKDAMLDVSEAGGDEEPARDNPFTVLGGLARQDRERDE